MQARGLIVDSFAGGGGASLGIAWALSRPPDVAVNHDHAAITMHSANHPSTRHVEEDVWRSDLRKLCDGRPVELLWASPDCTHFSRAKGRVPVSKEIRSLAWVVVRWAGQVKPAVIMLENVREFADWGPLVPLWKCRRCEWRGTESQALLARKRRRCPACNSLRLVETGDQFPDPGKKGTTFRLFLNRLRGLGYQVASRNLNAADYGAPTHRRRLFVIARCDDAPIVWPEPSHGDPHKLDSTPLFARLKPWRTAAECIDWTIPCPSIFDRKRPLAENTMRRIALGLKRYVLEAAEPFIVPITHAGERRNHGLDKPLGAVVAGGCKHALVGAFIAKHFAGVVGSEADAPLPTTTVRGTQNQLAAATLIRMNQGEKQTSSPAGPLGTVTTQPNKHNLVAASLIHLNYGEKTESGVDEPLRTITAGGKHAALVYSFLIRYFGTAIGQHVTEPLYTLTGKDRFGLVTVTIGGEPYVIVDIGMRKLTPRELARAQGFPDTYELTGTKTSQVAMIGNSVCPAVARALVEANAVGSSMTAKMGRMSDGG